MKLRLFLLSVMLLAVVVSWPLESRAQANVETMTTLQARIRALQAQIEAWKTRFSISAAPSVSVQGNSQVSIEAVPLVRPGSVSNTVCQPLIRELRLGSTDAVTNGEVSKVQAVLKAEGLFPAATPITGYVGPVTVEAIKKLQAREGLLVRPAVAAASDIQTETPVVDLPTRSVLSGKYCYQLNRGVIKPFSITASGHSNAVVGSSNDQGSGYDTTSLQLVAPNGGEVWQPGQTYTIRWAHPGTVDLEGVLVSINLRKGMRTEPVATIATNLPNQKSFEWTIPASLEAGADYRIAIFTRHPSDGRLVYDRSDAYFSIATPAATQ